MAAGAGQYGLATAAAMLTLVVLAVRPPIEAYFERRAGWVERHRALPTETSLVTGDRWPSDDAGDGVIKN